MLLLIRVTLILDSGNGMSAAVAYTLVLEGIVDEKYCLTCFVFVCTVGAIV